MIRAIKEHTILITDQSFLPQWYSNTTVTPHTCISAHRFHLFTSAVVPLDLAHRCEVHHSCKMASCGKTCLLLIRDLKFKMYTFLFGRHNCSFDSKKQTINTYLYTVCNWLTIQVEHTVYRQLVQNDLEKGISTSSYYHQPTLTQKCKPFRSASAITRFYFLGQ